MTENDLDALPPGTVVRSQEGSQWIRRPGIPPYWEFQKWLGRKKFAPPKPLPKRLVRYSGALLDLAPLAVVWEPSVP